MWILARIYIKIQIQRFWLSSPIRQNCSKNMPMNVVIQSQYNLICQVCCTLCQFDMWRETEICLRYKPCTMCSNSSKIFYEFRMFFLKSIAALREDFEIYWDMQFLSNKTKFSAQMCRLWILNCSLRIILNVCVLEVSPQDGPRQRQSACGSTSNDGSSFGASWSSTKTYTFRTKTNSIKFIALYSWIFLIKCCYFVRIFRIRPYGVMRVDTYFWLQIEYCSRPNVEYALKSLIHSRLKWNKNHFL